MNESRTHLAAIVANNSDNRKRSSDEIYPRNWIGFAFVIAKSGHCP